MRIPASVLRASVVMGFALGGFGCGLHDSSSSQVATNPFDLVPPGLLVDGGLAPPVRKIPTDMRPVRTAQKPPPPISGGTLLVTSDGKYAVAADPDRDRVSIVDLGTRNLSATIGLQPGDEPGRLAEDASGRVHVALRRGGAVVSIDLARQAIVNRRSVCATPRGIAYDPSADALRVACQSGELWTLPAADGDAFAPWSLAVDLRDVVVQGDKLFVTQLKSAQILRVDRSGAVVARSAPPELSITDPDPSGGMPISDVAQPEAARRTLALADGGMLMLHQAAREGAIPLDDPHSSQVTMVNPYGGGAGAASCDGVVRTAIAKLDTNGQVVGETQIPGVVAVDLAASYDGEVAVAIAGALEPDRQLQSVEFPGLGPRPPPFAVPPFGGLPIAIFRPGIIANGGPNGFCGFENANPVPNGMQITAVAYAPDGTLVAQNREPAELVIGAGQSTAPTIVELGGESVYDTGHEIFHRDAGGGIACASCHIEGAEDGHVWRFTNLGPRRTQALHVGIAGTEPFHWGGDMPNLSAIMDDVFVTRMGGVHETHERVQALESWVGALTPPSAIRPSDDAAALRGRALFEGEAACASCHAGEKFTNNMTLDVGKGTYVQVPSLRGVAYRAPFLHDGCAGTLRDRFDSACGGSRHGQTSQLGPGQIDDLVAYLETL